jgi:ADP-ribosylglycohydrolase
MWDASKGKIEKADTQIGFIRHGFVRAFYFLISGSSYEDAIRETLLAGGDTDTNAAIVGGLIGAAVGVEGIPLRMREAVMTCDTSKGRPRPEWLHPRNLYALANELVK